MENRGENKTTGVEKMLIKCCRKTKKMIMKITSHSDGNKVASIDQPSLSAPACSTDPSIVHCDELFVSGKKGTKAMDADSFMAYQIQAQTHFSMRPNIYL
ncbi:hypothetical protein DCAR_0522036 [Daucus carota subsp. sativus]|uniref:Uncharacterized protein n=1 Tax=Daucus carota subsp. sativus TaxID=79200 RepID=A0A164ZJH0_DAUCS|nr:hypothetical protein DCAR_0522036 [Daucus carota subsp. sativus]